MAWFYPHMCPDGQGSASNVGKDLRISRSLTAHRNSINGIASLGECLIFFNKYKYPTLISIAVVKYLDEKQLRRREVHWRSRFQDPCILQGGHSGSHHIHSQQQKEMNAGSAHFSCVNSPGLKQGKRCFPHSWWASSLQLPGLRKYFTGLAILVQTIHLCDSLQVILDSIWLAINTNWHNP